MAEHWTFQTPFIPPGEPITGKTYRADGWAYFDPPGRFSPEAWDHIKAVIGEGEYVILAESSGVHPSDSKPFCRGQLLISPAGLANIEASTRRES